jgi:hypothetical protein
MVGSRYGLRRQAGFGCPLDRHQRFGRGMALLADRFAFKHGYTDRCEPVARSAGARQAAIELYDDCEFLSGVCISITSHGIDTTAPVDTAGIRGTARASKAG